LDRCIVVNTEENVRRDIPVAFEKDKALELKPYLEMYGIRHEKGLPLYQKEEPYNIEELKAEISNYRVIELFGPLIAKCPSKTGRAHLLELAVEQSQDRKEENNSGEEARILAALYKIREIEKAERYAVSTIAKVFNEDREKWETKSPEWLGKKLRKFGLKPCRVGERSLHAILWDEKKLSRRFVRYGLSPNGSLGTSYVTDRTARTVSSPQDVTLDLPNGSVGSGGSLGKADRVTETTSLETSRAFTEISRLKDLILQRVLPDLQDRFGSATLPSLWTECCKLIGESLSIELVEKVVKSLEREGLIFNPSPGCYKLTVSSPAGEVP